MTTTPNHIMVDAHVHIHEHFSLNRLFLISVQNFRQALHAFNIHEPFESFLLLSESAGSDRFTELRELIDSPGKHDFTVSATVEPTTLRVTTGGGQVLHVVAGRQIVTTERLEVLALGLAGSYPDGRPLNYVLEDVGASGCLRVLPWGAGKWLGARGAVIESLLDTWEGSPLFLGDNGNRPRFWPLPSLFAAARTKKIYNLPGSDPLPVKDAEKKAGRFGCLLRGEIEEHHPFKSLRAHLLSTPSRVIPYGAAEKCIPFCKNQVAMQVAKRAR